MVTTSNSESITRVEAKRLDESSRSKQIPKQVHQHLPRRICDNELSRRRNSGVTTIPRDERLNRRRFSKYLKALEHERSGAGIAKRANLVRIRWAQRSAAERAGRARAKLTRTGCVERAFSDVEGLTGVTHVAYTGPGHVLAAREAPPIACQSGRIRGRPRACALGRTSVRSTTPSLAFSQLSSLRCTPAPCHPSPPHRRLPLGPANPAEPTSQRSHHYPRRFCAQSHPTLDT